MSRYICICTYYYGFLGIFVCQVHIQTVSQPGGSLAPSKPCFTSKLGFREIQVDVRTSDVMAGAGGAVGPAPDVQHQPEGNTSR